MRAIRRTKIVCTIGPASESVPILEKLMAEGMNVARLNFSHGTHEEHLVRVQAIRTASANSGYRVALMLDTKGPEIRTGRIKDGGTINLIDGERIWLTTEQIEGDQHRLSISYAGFAEDVRPGMMVLIADGLIGLKVLDIKNGEVECEVVNGGEIGSQKNVNIPGATIRLPALTQKDIDDVHFAIKNNMDFIAASFVRKASDVHEIRQLLEENDAEIDIIAKIENQEGLDNIDEIIKVADGVMVARGDLGVEIPTEEVPLVQKLIIKKCNHAGKPVVTATQMLESMVRNPRPTRAEASDVANAIFDGTDAIMLSGETASGKYPVEAVKTMARIANRTEAVLPYFELLQERRITSKTTIPDAIGHATCTTAHDLGASSIITPTASGSTARIISKYRPKAHIIACANDDLVLNKLCMAWGVIPLRIPDYHGTDAMIDEAIASSLEAKLIRCGDLVVLTAGVPAGVPGSTNLIKVHVVADVLARGTGIGNRAVVGRVCVALTPEEAARNVQPGDVLVTTSTDKEYIPAMGRISAIITEEGGLTSHAAIVGLNLGIPVVVGAKKATSRLKTGTVVTVDSVHGLVYRGATKIL